MKASVVDLRYKMKDVLRALERGEDVTVLHRGTVKGTIRPNINESQVSAADHPFFGSAKDDTRDVQDVMDDLRAPRHAL